jgi:hypothetical protein
MEDFRTAVPDDPFTLILGRPSAHSMTISVLPATRMQGYLRYGRQSALCTNVTATMDFRAGQPTNILVAGLDGDCGYLYQFCYRPVTAEVFTVSAEGTFHTQRSPDAPFVFTITADSHLDQNTDPALYAQTLRDARDDRPDFHIDLGDTFMTGKRGNHPLDALPQYLAQRHYFGAPGGTMPLFLVLGNHDGEFAEPGMPEATRMRTSFFPNPVPDGFFTGAAMADYYAWHWGDALFVVLDPFRFSTRTRGAEAGNWGFTLGRTQYAWLEKTLETSPARLRFVFIHHLVGGLDRQGRGGAEAVPFFEWGGRDPDGREAFADERPGWSLPIHALLVKHGVAAVFHGHDHFYARQEVDGIVYQLVPQPGQRGQGGIRDAAAYGYRGGDLRPGSGYLRVSVAGGAATVDFMLTRSPPGPHAPRPRTCACSYTLPAHAQPAEAGAATPGRP